MYCLLKHYHQSFVWISVLDENHFFSFNHDPFRRLSLSNVSEHISQFCGSISLPALKEWEEEVVSLCSCWEESGRAVVSGVTGPKDVPWSLLPLALQALADVSLGLNPTRSQKAGETPWQRSLQAPNRSGGIGWWWITKTDWVFIWCNVENRNLARWRMAGPLLATS